MATDKEYKAVIDALSGECERLHKENEELKKALENHDTFMKYAYSQGKQDALSQEPTEICCATCKHERLDDRNYKCEFQNECLVEGKRGKYEFAYAKYEPIVEQEPCTDNVSEKEQKPCKYCDEDGFCLTQNLCISQRTICNKYYAEQEPCGDAVSRDALIAKLTELIKTSRSTIEIKAKLIPMIEQLPSVTQKSGKWIKIQSGDKDFPESIVCSKCGSENSHLDFNENAEPIGKVFVTSKYCPNCGAKMESEDKE